jgi:membrane associated rhomboid family serine protease
MNYGLPPFPKGIRTLCIVTAAVWLVELLPGIGDRLAGLCDLLPYKTFGQFELWRLFTYQFLHDPSGPFHLLFNLLTLWMFGAEIEEMWGPRRFTLFYCIAGMGAGLFSCVTVASPALWFTPVIGASGSVLALLTVYALYFPHRKILLFFLFPVNVIVAVVIFGAISLIGSVQSWGNVSHLTHLGGIAVGFLYVKGMDGVNGFFGRIKAQAACARERHEERRKTEAGEYFEKVVDPVLKKISGHGMGSLTKEERAVLEEASRRKRNRGGPEGGTILPFGKP